jgi:hypothetical protein
MNRILMAAILAIAAAPAYAQTSQATNAASGSVANAIVYSGAAGGSGTTTYRGGIENVPSMLGSLAVAPCTTAAQIGGAFMGGGFTASLGSESEGCARRANAAAFHALGRDDIALALLAQDATVAKAIRTVEEARAAAKPALVVSTLPAFLRPAWCDTASAAQQAANISCR